MLHERIQQHPQRAELAQIVTAMPAFPIYHELGGSYSIYVEAEQQLFPTEAAARLGQMVARERWLRHYGCQPAGANV